MFFINQTYFYMKRLNIFSLLHKTVYVCNICAIFVIVFFIKAHSQNMITDSSFELGLDRATTGNIFRRVEGEASHGRHFLRLIDKTGYFNSRKLEPGKYTFSAYLRTQKNGTAVMLRMGSGRWSSEKKEIILGETWQRHHLTAELKAVPYSEELGNENIYSCFIDKNNSDPVDVDAVQWEKGELAEYKAAQKFCIAVRSGAYANIFFEHEPLDFTAGIYNSDKAEKKFSFQVTVSDADNKIFFNSADSCTVAAESLYEKKFVKAPGLKGFFKITAVLADENSRKIDTHTVHAARVAALYDGNMHLNSFFGIHPFNGTDDSELLEKRWGIIKNSGARWSRIFFNWRIIETKKGEYAWDAYYKESDIVQSDKNKMAVLLVFSDVLKRGAPKWAVINDDVTGGFPEIDLEQFCKYIETAVTRYSGKVHTWELANEPYLSVPGDKYCDEHARIYSGIYQIVKTITPDIPAVANIGGFGQIGEDANFLSRLLDRDLLKWIDGLSVHFYLGKYPLERDSRIENAVASIRNLAGKYGNKNITVLQTEGATCANDLFDPVNHQATQYRLMMQDNAFGYTSEIEAARNGIRAMIIEISSGITRTFWFMTGAYTQYKVYQLLGMIRDHWRSPKIIYPAFNAMALLIDETKPLGELSRNEKFRAYAFKKGEKVIIPFWHLMSGKGFGRLAIGNSAKIEKIYDFMGNEIIPEKTGSVTRLPLDEAPYYIQAPFSELKNIEALMLAGKHEDFKGAAGISVAIGSGEKNPVAVIKIQNNTSGEISGFARAARYPAGIKIEKEGLIFGPVAGMSAYTVKIPISAISGECRGEMEGIVRIGDRMTEFKKDIVFMHSTESKNIISVDARDDEWSPAEPLRLASDDRILSDSKNDREWNGEKDLSLSAWSCWRGDMLYFYIKVVDNIIIQDRERPFQGDCVQLFFDCDTAGDAENTFYNDDDVQINFVPASGGENGFFAIVGDKAKHDRFSDIKYASRSVKDGYFMEIGIPSASLGVKAIFSGTVFGFNIAVDERDEAGEKKRRKCEMIWAGRDNKMWKFTDRFGFILCR
ncbi:MAG: hypothetical protein A2096_06460 [Spirochaetes bacterium GWF1_41_5]|nr:MAG: hypothetical protein A2096_06460 [Spirochaetes bacterium GWF1_41_5]HBE01237.1 hypothetical protein [Spirochaetia bacterium]